MKKLLLLLFAVLLHPVATFQPTQAQTTVGVYNEQSGTTKNVVGVTMLTPSGSPTTSATSTPTAGTTSATPNAYTSALAASTTRRGCLIQNTSATTLRVFTGAPGSATDVTALQIPAGGTFSCASPGGLVITDQISVANSVASAPYVSVVQ